MGGNQSSAETHRVRVSPNSPPLRQVRSVSPEKEKLFISRNPRESCIIGRAEIDLSSLTSDRINQMSVALRGEESCEEVCQLNLVLWVTGVNGAETCGAAGAQQRRENIGNLTVRVLQASGLGSSRLQGAKEVFFYDQN